MELPFLVFSVKIRRTRNYVLEREIIQRPHLIVGF